MFTGIVSAMGRIVAVEPTDGGARMRVEAGEAASDLSVGDSVAVNGVCLTAVAVDGGTFEVEAVAETLDRTNLGRAAVGDAVNLERPVAASGRLDGHIVQGHVDVTGIVRTVVPEGDSIRVWVDLDRSLMRYVAEKGSVAVDGVSLTVTAVDDAGFEVALIPHTLAVTAWRDRGPGDGVNVEVDVLAKYVERLMEAR
jgi:riboflavin synthase